MNNREAFEAWLKSRSLDNTQTLDACDRWIYKETHIQAMYEGWQAGLASQAQQNHSEDAINMVQSQAQQESQAFKALKGMIELWFRTRESGCLPIEVAHAQFVLKTLLPQ